MRSSISSSSRLWIAIVAFVALTAFGGGLKLWGMSRIDPALLPIPDAFWREKTFAKPIYDIVVVGDSRVFRDEPGGQCVVQKPVESERRTADGSGPRSTVGEQYVAVDLDRPSRDRAQVETRAQ